MIRKRKENCLSTPPVTGGGGGIMRVLLPFDLIINKISWGSSETIKSCYSPRIPAGASAV